MARGSREIQFDFMGRVRDLYFQRDQRYGNLLSIKARADLIPNGRDMDEILTLLNVNKEEIYKKLLKRLERSGAFKASGFTVDDLELTAIRVLHDEMIVIKVGIKESTPELQAANKLKHIARQLQDFSLSKCASILSTEDRDAVNSALGIVTRLSAKLGK